MNVGRAGVVALVAGAAAVSAVLLTGCATTTTSGRAAGPAPTTAPTTASTTASTACGQDGTSADAARGTVRCYLNALAASDTTTACSELSPRVRSHLASEGAGSGSGDTNNVYRVPGVSDPADPPATGGGANCATVAPLMRRALDQLPATERAALSAALRGAEIGDVRLAGSSATVQVTVTVSGRTGTQRVAVVQDAGSWKIDSAEAFGTGS